MTYQPLSSRVQHILIINFNILTGDPATAAIFPAPPVITHRRDGSPWDILVHTFDRSQTECYEYLWRAGLFPDKTQDRW